jgi:hypothetical protein
MFFLGAATAPAQTAYPDHLIKIIKSVLRRLSVDFAGRLIANRLENSLGPAGGGGSPQRRRRHAGRELRGEIAARRLHADDHVFVGDHHRADAGEGFA